MSYKEKFFKNVKCLECGGEQVFINEDLREPDTKEFSCGECDCVFIVQITPLNKSKRECPFCGFKKPEYIQDPNFTEEEKDFNETDGFYVCCNAQKGGCGATGGYGDTKEDALKNWEKRTNEL